MLMKANILAKASFLQQIPNLAYAYTVIDMWLRNFFASPLHDPSVSKGANPPPSTNLAIGAGGKNPGVLGKNKTNFFHATPKRDRPPDTLATHEESLHSNKGGEGTAASPLPTNLTKLVHQQNCPSQAEPLPQYTQAAATTTTPPACQQNRAASPPGWAAAETLPTLAGLHVPAQTTASLPSITDGRHGVRDECQLHRPPRCSIFGWGSAPSSPSHRSILCLPERNVFEVDPGEAVHAHAPASGHPDQPAVPLHGDQHANHCLGTQPASGSSGRGDRGPSKAEPVVRITAAPLTVDGSGQP